MKETVYIVMTDNGRFWDQEFFFNKANAEDDCKHANEVLEEKYVVRQATLIIGEPKNE